jgi:hypothetical protein
LKLENAANNQQSIEKQVNTTVANAWETLTFDFTGFNSSTLYNKVNVFPNFGNTETADKNYYFDELKYTIGTAPVIAPLVFASNYAGTTSSQGGTIGNYADWPNVTTGWGDAVGDVFYFGYHMNTTYPAGYLGGYVTAPGNGTAALGARTSVTLNVGGNPELFSRNPTLVVLLNGPNTAAGCTPIAKGTFTITSTSLTPYTIQKANLTVKNGCPGLDTPALIWANGIKEVHVQVPANQMQYATSNANGYPNGLNIGTITFQ